MEIQRGYRSTVIAAAMAGLLTLLPAGAFGQAAAGTTYQIAMDTFGDNTGAVGLKLWKGTLNVTKRVSPFSLYRADLASFTMGRYNPKDAEGFINLFALPVTVRPKAKAEGSKQ